MSTDSGKAKPATLDRDTVLRDVSQVVAEQLGMDVDKIRASDAFVEDLGCDSLDVVEISMELEEHFDISIPDEFGDTAKTVGDAVDGIMRLLGEACRDGR